MATSRFQVAVDTGEAYEVHMNQVHLLIFGSNSIRAIGTQNLNGCTAVAIVSPLAAILAHIPPQPYLTQDPGVGMQNVITRMIEMSTIYQQYQAYFPPGRTSLVVGARFGGMPALPEQLDIVRHYLQQNGLTPFLVTYDATPGGHLHPARGTVFIDARSGNPVVYVEDQLIQM